MSRPKEIGLVYVYMCARVRILLLIVSTRGVWCKEIGLVCVCMRARMRIQPHNEQRTRLQRTQFTRIFAFFFSAVI